MLPNETEMSYTTNIIFVNQSHQLKAGKQLHNFEIFLVLFSEYGNKMAAIQRILVYFSWTKLISKITLLFDKTNEPI